MTLTWVVVPMTAKGVLIMIDRFAITYDEQGRQKYNPYIGLIAAGVIRYWEKREHPLNMPELTYGMIHRDRKILEMWEKRLKAEGLL